MYLPAYVKERRKKKQNKFGAATLPSSANLGKSAFKTSAFSFHGGGGGGGGLEGDSDLSCANSVAEPFWDERNDSRDRALLTGKRVINTKTNKMQRCHLEKNHGATTSMSFADPIDFESLKSTEGWGEEGPPDDGLAQPFYRRRLGENTSMDAGQTTGNINTAAVTIPTLIRSKSVAAEYSFPQEPSYLRKQWGGTVGNWLQKPHLGVRRPGTGENLLPIRRAQDGGRARKVPTTPMSRITTPSRWNREGGMVPIDKELEARVPEHDETAGGGASDAYTSDDFE